MLTLRGGYPPLIAHRGYSMQCAHIGPPRQGFGGSNSFIDRFLWTPRTCVLHAPSLPVMSHFVNLFGTSDGNNDMIDSILFVRNIDVVDLLGMKRRRGKY